VLIGSRVVRVKIPDPTRFAAHKLLISSERSETESGKARKDIDQAARWLHVLLTDRPGDPASA
jgi:hypothetical protein